MNKIGGEGEPWGSSGRRGLEGLIGRERAEGVGGSSQL